VWQIVDKTIMEADQDQDGKISFEEFKKMVENTDVSMSMTLGMLVSSIPLTTSAARFTDNRFLRRSILAVLTAIPAGSVARRCKVSNSCWAQFITAWKLRRQGMRKIKKMRKYLDLHGVRHVSWP
jgi:hypothetical protein